VFGGMISSIVGGSIWISGNLSSNSVLSVKDVVTPGMAQAKVDTMTKPIISQIFNFIVFIVFSFFFDVISKM
jgi:hypothetical protein